MQIAVYQSNNTRIAESSLTEHSSVSYLLLPLRYHSENGLTIWYRNFCSNPRFLHFTSQRESQRYRANPSHFHLLTRNSLPNALSPNSSIEFFQKVYRLFSNRIGATLRYLPSSAPLPSYKLSDTSHPTFGFLRINAPLPHILCSDPFVQTIRYLLFSVPKGSVPYFSNAHIRSKFLPFRYALIGYCLFVLLLRSDIFRSFPSAHCLRQKCIRKRLASH